jgi:Flp pilus assembly protein TadG
MNKCQSRIARRGSILVLTAFLLIALAAMVAFSVDLGYIVLVRTQLQAAADAAALASAAKLSISTDVFPAAQEFAQHNKAHGKTVVLKPADVQIGVWNSATRVFTPAQGGNAVRVTARSAEGVPLFFGRIFGKTSLDTQASAVAVCNPRDIAFVVDLSGSMNDDTEPCWATVAINSTFGSQGYPTIGNDLMQDLYTDLNFGTFPGTLAWIGSGLVSANSSAYANLTANGGPLTSTSIATTYRIASSDSEATRKQKAYKWIIDNQLKTLMPAAKPTPSSSSSYSYWEKYLDYVIQSTSVSGRGTLPPSQDSDRISSYNNPNTATFPSAAGATGWRNQVGYRTYVQWLMDNGRDIQQDGSTYPQHSQYSSFCPYHSESTAGGTFSFPPREQPTHAARRALIAALQVIKDRNLNITDPNQQDQVSVITFDHRTSGGVIAQPLTNDFQKAMLTCTKLQAVGDIGASTATETGLIAARQHIAPPSEGGSGRQNVNKIIVLLTDGVPNDYSSGSNTISSYINSNPSSNFYSSGKTAYNAALMQSSQMNAKKWAVYPVGLGLGTDYDFMDRMARMGGTANDNGQSPRGSGDPAQYEQRLADIFKQIIDNPRVRLVQ